jgi:hypothetical protein
MNHEALFRHQLISMENQIAGLNFTIFTHMYYYIIQYTVKIIINIVQCHYLVEILITFVCICAHEV